AGGAGADAWGGWLRDRLEAEGVGLGWFGLHAHVATPVSFVTVGESGAGSSTLYGDTLPAVVDALGDRLLQAVDQCDALYLTANTLALETGRALTVAARDRALAQDQPVIFDPRLELDRWESPGRAAGEARDIVKGAFLVACTRHEARLLSGEDDPAAAAEGLLAMGARHVLVRGAGGGALLRGSGLRGDVRAVAPEGPIVSAVGTDDAFMSVVLGRLAATGFYPPAIVAALRDAVEEAARSLGRWGALA
ncbi:MAG TPA: carbohydrate kinase family protein, partial [Solirubrobacteraceae bacterium]|nr:carbohydrate kinase family protein [Solirubrobacteraceae bacterium]